MAKSAQVSKILPYLRLVGGTDFNDARGDSAIVRPLSVALDTLLAAHLETPGSEKGSFHMSGTKDGWVFIDGCIPFNVAAALLETYVSARA